MRLPAVIPCRRCGYNLIGSPPGGRCPECGTPVAFSRRSDQLCEADPEYVRLLERGAAVTFWAVILLVATAVCAAVGKRGRNVPVAMATTLGQGLYLLGTVLLTTPDPSGLGEDRYGTRRRAVRWTVPFSATGVLAAVVLRMAVTPPTATSVLACIDGVGVLADVVGLTFTLSYVGRLAARTADVRLEGAAGSLVGWLGVPLVIIVCLVELLEALRTAPSSAAGTALGMGACVCALPLLAGGPMYLVVLRRLVHQLRAEAAAARRSWGVVSLAAPPVATASCGPAGLPTDVQFDSTAGQIPAAVVINSHC